MWVILGLILGIVLGPATNYVIPAVMSKFVAIGIIAAVDSVVGAWLANMQKTFDVNIFISGFFVNTILAMGLTYIGYLLDVDMSLAAIIVFGTRIFSNFAAIRRQYFTRIKIKKAKEENK